MKPFEIQLQGKPYTIKLKSFGRVDINGTTQYIRSLPHRNVLFIPMEYDLPIPEGKVMLTSGLFRTHLVVDGVDQITGKPYTPISKVPFWGYIFAILDLTMCLGGGMVPAILAFLAFDLTLKVSATESYPVGVRILLSVVLLAGGWLLLLLLAVLMSLALG